MLVSRSHEGGARHTPHRRRRLRLLRASRGSSFSSWSASTTCSRRLHVADSRTDGRFEACRDHTQVVWHGMNTAARVAVRLGYCAWLDDAGRQSGSWSGLADDRVRAELVRRRLGLQGWCRSQVRSAMSRRLNSSTRWAALSSTTKLTRCLVIGMNAYLGVHAIQSRRTATRLSAHPDAADPRVDR